MNFFNTAVNFFKDGGFFLYPLALIFVVGVSIAIERYVYLTRETMRNRSLWDALVPALGSGNFKQVVSLTQNSKASIATILNYGVARVASARRRDDIEKAMDESLLEVIPRIEKRTHYLSSLANVGLLIGLLGTITGIGEPGRKGQFVVARDLGRNEQHGFRFGCRNHVVARAHVSGIQDHLIDRQPRNRVGEILEFDHRASRRIGEFVDRAVDCAGRTCGCPQQRLNT
jgi:hypothetical protein